MKPEEFIAKIAPAAQACQKMSGIPASFTIAQAALESAWGTSKLSTLANNLFGVKADRGWKGATASMNTAEYINGKRFIVPAEWRLYRTWGECLADRANFFRVNKRYAKCFAEKTGEGWARAVAAAGYATDPLYAKKLIATINARKLTRFDQPEAT